MGTGTGALIGINHCAALFQAPLPGGANGAVDPAGTRGGRGYHARKIRIKAVGHLGHYRHRHSGARHLHQRNEFLARNSATGVIHGRTKQAAIASAGCSIHQCPVIVVDGQPAQLRRCRIQGIDKRRWCGTGQTLRPQACGKKIIGIAIVIELLDITHQEIRQGVEHLVLLAGSKRHRGSTYQGAEHHSFHGRSLFVVVESAPWAPRPMRILCQPDKTMNIFRKMKNYWHLRGGYSGIPDSGCACNGMARAQHRRWPQTVRQTEHCLKNQTTDSETSLFEQRAAS